MNRKLLASAICASLLAAGVAHAQATSGPQQDQPAQAPQTLSTITVTGTHIRKAQIETAQPVVVLDRTAIEHQGFNTVADILQNLTMAGTPPISRSEVLASGESVGGYYIDLRNLGANRTLVLLNGKRLGVTTDGWADLQQVPIAAIERIEVLKDGASSIYGSDAIAGVVNIITRSNFNGAEASAYVGQYDEGDGTSQTYSMSFGTKSDRGSVTLVAEYSKNDPVWAKDRWFSQFPSTTRHPKSGWTLVSQWGAFFNPGDGWCGAGLCTLDVGGDPFNLADYHPTGQGGGTNDRTNTNTEMMLQTQLDRKSLFASANYNISDNIRFQTDILYNRRETLQQVAGYPFQPAFALPGGNADEDPIGLDPASYYNPLGDRFLGAGNGEKLWFYRRGWEVPRTTSSQLSTYRIGGTLSGNFNIGDHTWNWDVGGFVNQNDLVKIGHGDFSLIATALALGPSFRDASGQVVCGTPSNPIPYGTAPGSCVPWNPIYPAGQVGEGSLSGNPDLQTFLFPYYHDTGRTKTTDYSANITGSIVTLPAGDLAVAAGFEYRREDGKFVPDAFSQAGISTNLSSGPTQGSYNVKEFYVEVDVPLLKELPFAHELSVNAAGRHSRYNTFGSTTNAKYSLSWRPIQDLLVRATYAEGFRAPAISDLYGGLGGTFDYYTDPCDVNHEAGSNPAVAQRCSSGFGGQAPVPANYVQIGQGGSPCTNYPCQTGTQFFAGASPTLQPETSTSKTAGIVYSPDWLPGRLDLTLDWYRIHIDNAMTGDSVSSMLHDCYVLGVASRCSGELFRRNPTTGVVNYALRGLKNAGWVDTEGWDFGAAYQFPQMSFGQFKLVWNTTYTSHLNEKADNDPTTPIDHNTSWGGDFRIRSNASLDWSLGDFGATWTTRYYSSMKESCSWNNTPQGGPECNMPGYVENNVVFNANRMGANTFHDLQVRYTAPWKGTVSFGANNVFGHWAGPMYSRPNSQYPYYGGFDIGRFYYIRYNQRF